MSYEMEMPSDFDTGGAFLQEPGTYHLAVMAVDESPVAKDGAAIDGFKVDLEVLAGGQQKKQAEVTFWKPKATDKNNGEMAKKKQGRFVQATGILPAPKPGEKVTVDLKTAVGRQLIATLAKRKSQSSDKEFIDLNFADIWHVDDPEAPQCERNQKALDLIPKGLRRDRQSFAKASDATVKAPAGSGNGNGAAGATAAPAKQPISLDQL
jgi:hypothetical protein